MFTFIYNAVYHTLFSHANEILPGLWLGDYTSALDSTFIDDNKIDVVVNCTPDKPFISELQASRPIETVRLTVYDSLLERDFILMEDYFKFIIPFLIQRYVKEQKNILIHCHAGKQRSGIVVAAFLYKLIITEYLSPQAINLTYATCSKEQLASNIVSYMLTKRPQVFTYGFRINFIRSFRRFFGLSVKS